MLASAALAVLLVAVPMLGNGYIIYMACLVAINVIATVGLNITTGYTGLLSIGQAAFVGVGAYTAALCWLHFGIPLILAVPLAALAAFAVGLVVGVPSLRIRGVYLVIATLAAQYCLYFMFRDWNALTGGDRGLNIPAATLAGISLDRDVRLYCVLAPVSVAACLFARNLFRTRIGRAFIAVRERESSAEVFGIPVGRTKLLSFGIGAAYAGIAGAFVAFFYKVVTPDQFSLDLSILYLTAVVVGGRGSILGSILGAVFVTLVPELLAAIVGGFTDIYPQAMATVLSPLREAVMGALIIGFLLFEPRGLAGIVQRWLA
jgi:branched-chain amino acid transport system permease protein